MKTGGSGIQSGSNSKSSSTKKSSSRLDMRKSVEVQVDSDFALLLPSGIYEIKKMEPRPKLRSIIIICMILAVAGIIGFGYFCPDQVCVSIKHLNVSTLHIHLFCCY